MTEPIVSDIGSEPPKFEDMTVKQMREWAKENEVKLPWNLSRKAEYIEFLNEHTHGG